MTALPALCRDCGTSFDAPSGARARCPSCRSPRVAAHAELHALPIAHMDCDAFYAAVEKREDPSLRDLPLIIGGGKRGVVSTACYIARTRGVRSAMPMFKALKLCPDAVVVKPRMALYVKVSRAIRALMDELTPLVEPLSLDEAFLDLRGTERLHGMSPAQAMARLMRRIEAEAGISASVGLSHNKFLAKIASDLNKPRGFSVIGRAETLDFLEEKPVSVIWGAGRATVEKLEKDGLRTIRDVRMTDRARLAARHGAFGERLWRLAHGEDARPVARDAAIRSISSETTFEDDLGDRDLLDGQLWRMAEKVASRAKAKGLAGRVVALKLKRADFRLISRRATQPGAVQLADRIYRAARPMLERELAAGPFRLLGVGISDLRPEAEAERLGDLLDPDAGRRGAAERAADRIRARFGDGAILKGRSLR